jgi:hypothetical protein
MFRSATLSVLCAIASSCVAADYPVADIAAFDDAMRRAVAGDVIVLQTGEWKDVDLRVRGEGQKEKPITVRAVEPARLSSRAIHGCDSVASISWWRGYGSRTASP